MPMGNPRADTVVRIQDFKQSVRAATTAALPANTRTGNVLDADANGTFPAIDGVTFVVGESLLVKDEATGANNGAYDITDLGSGSTKWKLTRRADFDQDTEVTTGATVFISEGTANAGAQYTLTTVDPITVNTTSLTFSQTGGTTPMAHAFGGAQHTADTLANVNTKISDATLDDSSASRTPTAHALGGAAHTADTLANLNSKVSDATLDDSGASRTPTVHALGGAEHSADTLANLNAKVSDATLDDSGASRTPSGTAGGDLNGTYPNPSVDDGADATAIHDNVAAEISAVTEKTTPVAADLLLMEDSAAANVKKRVQVGNLPGTPAIFSAESDGDSSTTGTGFTQKLRLTFTAEAADYLIFYSAEIRSSKTNVTVLAQMQEDDTITHAENEVLPDSPGQVGYGSFSGVKRVTLTAASHDFDIDFASSTSGQTVNIRRARLVAMKVQ